jgi:hypothetical protein
MQGQSETPSWSRLDWLLVVRLLAGSRTIDDAYITFRYARNLAEGPGFVYNPG